MTLAPSDSPDWTGIPGALRFLGTCVITGAGHQFGTLDFTPTSYDGAVYLVSDLDPVSNNPIINLSVTNLNTGVRTLDIHNWPLTDQVRVAFVARELGASWRVAADQFFPSIGGPFTTTIYVFAAPTFPVSKLMAGDIALPVRTYLDGPRQPYDNEQFSAPGALTLASITFAAVTSQRWVLDHASWTLRNTAATGGLTTAEIRDGPTVVYSEPILVPAVASSVERLDVGPGAGYFAAAGNDLIVRFGAAPAANLFEACSAGAYLLPVGE